MPFKKSADFVDVKRSQVAAEEMPQRVSARVAEGVGGVQSGESQVFYRSWLAARPEIGEAVDFETLSRRVPETEMQLQGQRQVRVEIVAAPFPSGFANQRGQVIGGLALGRIERF